MLVMMKAEFFLLLLVITAVFRKGSACFDSSSNDSYEYEDGGGEGTESSYNQQKRHVPSNGDKNRQNKEPIRVTSVQTLPQFPDPTVDVAELTEEPPTLEPMLETTAENEPTTIDDYPLPRSIEPAKITVTVSKPITTSRKPSRTLPGVTDWANDQICGKGNNHVTNKAFQTISQFPWQVRIVTQTPLGLTNVCGGALINNQWVLTAAQCVKALDMDGSKTTVYLGSQTLRRSLTSVKTPGEIAILTQSEVVHPLYNDDTQEYDIALLKLNRAVQFNDQIRPICMLPANCSGIAPPGTTCYISGWSGKERQVYSSVSSDELRIARIPLVSNGICKQALKKAAVDTVVTDRNVCAGLITVEDFEDNCPGDQGGPLVCTKQGSEAGGDQFYFNGIMSFAYGCTRRGLYNVYTRPCNLMNWIAANIKQ